MSVCSSFISNQFNILKLTMPESYDSISTKDEKYLSTHRCKKFKTAHTRYVKHLTMNKSTLGGSSLHFSNNF